MMLAQIVLAAHLLVIAFNLFGLAAIPIGAGRGWKFVRRLWFRLLHLLALTLVAIQALLGRACFLTIWQDSLSPISDSHEPLIMRWVNALIFWPLPAWLFTLLYVAIWLYALALLRIVPMHRHRTP
jgi:hypothetical protein